VIGFVVDCEKLISWVLFFNCSQLQLLGSFFFFFFLYFRPG
jgi:hypothetical protein